MLQLMKHTLYLPILLVLLIGSTNSVKAQQFVNFDLTVDLTGYNYEPSSSEVYVIGNFNNWDTEAHLRGLYRLNRIGEFLYKITFPMSFDPPLDFLEFKFILKNLNTGHLIWEDDPNRVLAIVNDVESIGTDTTFIFNQMINSSTASRNITFKVDVSGAVSEGLFDESLGDIISVVGSFNGWSSTTPMEFMVESGFEYYTSTLPILGNESSSIQYKYKISAGDARELPNDGWEILIDQYDMPDPWLNRAAILDADGVDMVLGMDYYMVPVLDTVYHEILSIREVRESDVGREVFVQGILTTPNFGDPGGFIQFFIQDESSGIRVYIPPTTTPNIDLNILQPGMFLQVKGEKTLFNGEHQITGVDVTSIFYAGLPNAIMIHDPVNQWVTNGPYAGMRVFLKDMELHPDFAHIWPTYYNTGAGNNLVIRDHYDLNKEYELRIDFRASEFNGSPMPPPVFHITGVLSEFMGVPQIMPFFLNEISEAFMYHGHHYTFEEDIDWTNFFYNFDGGFASVVANPFPSGINTSGHVGQMIKHGGSPWGGAFFDLDIPLDLVAAPNIKIKVLSPRENATLLFKIENSANFEQSHEVLQTIGTAGKWVELVYDFSSANQSIYYDRIVLIFDIGIIGDGSPNFTYYFDDISVNVFPGDDDIQLPYPIELVASDAGVLPGQGFYVDVMIGSPQHPIDNLYGVGASVEYDNYNFTLTETQRGSLFSGFETDIIEMVVNEPGAYSVHFSYSLTDNLQTLPTYGQVVRLFFTVNETADKNFYWFSINNAEAIDNYGEFLSLVPFGMSIAVVGDGLYPGDTDLNGIVDAFDILPLGTWFDHMGPPRGIKTIQWLPQDYIAWDPEIATYADANGDGIVNQNDLLAIGFNFGKTTPMYTTSAKLVGQAEQLSVVKLPNMSPGESKLYEVHLGGSNNPIDFVHQFAVNLGLDRSMVRISNLEIADWFQSPKMLQLDRYDAKREVHSMAFARVKGENSVRNGGAILLLEFEATDYVPDGYTVTLDRIRIDHGEGRYFYPEISFVPVGGLSVTSDNTPMATILMQNYPNPFNPTTTINYTLDAFSDVSLRVFDLLGREVAMLVDGQQSVGRHEVQFDASGLSSGMYIYRLEANGLTITRKMMLMK
jgi:hypothetical protein